MSRAPTRSPSSRQAELSAGAFQRLVRAIGCGRASDRDVSPTSAGSSVAYPLGGVSLSLLREAGVKLRQVALPGA